jgi:transposase
MRLKVILNRIEKHPGFVYTKARWVEAAGETAVEIGIRPRVGGRAICSGCQKPAPGYDLLAERRFEYVPLWGIAVFLVYPMRRVGCRRCGVRVEQVPWATGKQQLTRSYLWFLARWARRLSWSEVARIFGTSWSSVFRAVEGAVEWGRAQASFAAIEAIGVDEVQWRRGHKYLTVVYEISGPCRRLLWLGEQREEETLRGFFAWLGAERAAKIRFVCSDMWQPYLNVIAEKLPRAIHVLDRFHIVQTMNKAIDEVRAKEARTLKEAGAEPVLTHSRWCLLKRPRNLTDKQAHRLQDLLRQNLRTVRAYLLKEDFQFLWGYASAGWAGRFLDAWCTRALRSRIEPMRKIARSLRAHRPLILNWFRARQLIALGAVEGFNNKLKLTTRRSYGFRVFRVIEIALYHALGNLPEPEGTHRFC